jgi:cytochrome bd-type quinol oxidase subunit 1
MGGAMESRKISILLAGIVLGNLGIEAGWVFGKYGRFI